MCKVLIMTGIDNSENALKFMKAAKEPMSRMDRDGIGYSAVNSNNELFMQKWHNNDNFLDTVNVVDKELLTELEPYKNRLRLKENYTSYGNVTLDDLKAVTMHTRWATCGREFENTHPFVYNETSLIHNGTINNSRELNLNKISTCDSETALQVYLNNQVDKNPTTQNIQNFLDTLKGYWAFGILAKDSDGNYVIDVVREGASLYFCRIPELGKNNYVFATTEEIIKAGLTALGVKSKISFFKESQYLRFNALTGELIIGETMKTSKSNSSKYSYYSGNGKSAIEKDDSYFSKKNSTESEIDDQLAFMEDKSFPLFTRLDTYDDLMKTRISDIFVTMPEFLKNRLKVLEKIGTITFDEIVQAIEIYVKEKKTKDVLDFLEKKAG